MKKIQFSIYSVVSLLFAIIFPIIIPQIFAYFAIQNIVQKKRKGALIVLSALILAIAHSLLRVTGIVFIAGNGPFLWMNLGWTLLAIYGAVHLYKSLRKCQQPPHNNMWLIYLSIYPLLIFASAFMFAGTLY